MPAGEPLLASRAQKAFMFTSVLSLLFILPWFADTREQVDEAIPSFSGRYKTLPCFLSLFALAEKIFANPNLRIFELVMAFDALRLRNIIQLAGIILFHFALIVMGALQIHQTELAVVKKNGCTGTVDYNSCDGKDTLWADIKPYLIVAPCVIAASWIVICFLVRQLYQEFGWAIFHVVGANPKMKTMYQFYQVMICLLKFDFFFFASVTMQLLIVVLQTSSTEFGLTIAAIPIVLVLLVLCGVAVQREIKSIMTISLGLLDFYSCFIYKLIRFYQPSQAEVYATTRASLTMFTIVAFLLLFCTFAVGLRCFADFDRGLLSSKVHDSNITKTQVPLTPNMSQRQSSYGAGAPLAARISIE
ncbi:hypothetical protein DL96DRAFT_1456946 [Flagelloscypha sp. PMI_526]|nr:hypothetical protein DL96DRAFT_1456946 [Flagelloscypha sp. PMI_526]